MSAYLNFFALWGVTKAEAQRIYRVVDDGAFHPNFNASLSTGLFLPGLFGLRAELSAWDSLPQRVFWDLELRATTGIPGNLSTGSTTALASASQKLSFRVGPAQQKWRLKRRNFILGVVKGFNLAGQRVSVPARYPVLASAGPFVGAEFGRDRSRDSSAPDWYERRRLSAGWVWLRNSDTTINFDGYGQQRQAYASTSSIALDYGQGGLRSGMGILLKHETRWPGLLYGASFRAPVGPRMDEGVGVDQELGLGEVLEALLYVGIPFQKRLGADPAKLDLACVSGLISDEKLVTKDLRICHLRALQLSTEDSGRR